MVKFCKGTREQSENFEGNTEHIPPPPPWETLTFIAIGYEAGNVCMLSYIYFISCNR
jgi:hypothetical protein